jgi:hypothetical protein
MLTFPGKDKLVVLSSVETSTGIKEEHLARL